MKRQSSKLAAFFSSLIPASLPVVAVLCALTASIVAQTSDSQPQKQPPAQQPAQDPNQQTDFKIILNTALITVPVIVTDSYGRFVTGLKEKDFQVREDNQLQKIDLFSSTEAPFNVALLIDASYSTHNKLGLIRKAALSFLKQLQPNDRVMVATFEKKVNYLSDFTNDQKVLAHAINSVETGYYTSLYDAIYRTVTDKLKPLKGRKAIVVLTDGVDTSSSLATAQSAIEMAANNGVISYTIQYETRNDGGRILKPIFLPGSNFVASPFGSLLKGRHQEMSDLQSEQQEPPSDKPMDKATIRIPRPNNPIITYPSTSPPTEPAHEKPRSSGQIIYLQQNPVRDRYLVATDFLRDLAMQSGARYLRAESLENTSYAFAMIAEELRHQYTLTYYPTNDKRDGRFRTISVKVSTPDGLINVRTRQGYRAPSDSGNQ